MYAADIWFESFNLLWSLDVITKKWKDIYVTHFASFLLQP